jgi:hypothetical protein
MRPNNIKAALAAALLSAAFSPARAQDEKDLAFSGMTYPLEFTLSASRPAGAVLSEIAFSEPPAFDYDTVLLQGEMPQPEVRLDLVTAGKDGVPARFQQTAFRRFPNGRFWARYSLGSAGRMPLKLSVVNLGLRQDCTLVVYGIQLMKAAAMREEPVQQSSSTYIYVPDPALSVPDTVPFHVIRRADWGAKPPTQAYLPHKPYYFTIHHTQSHYPKTYKEAVAEMQFIQDYHQNGHGWIDIGYHFVIDPMGDIFEGRPIGVVGAHVKNYNTGNIGISIMGDYHPPVHDPITPASLNSFVAIGTYLKDTYNVNVSSFYAHRELEATDCPGDDLYARKGELRGRIFGPQPAAPVVLPLPDAASMPPAQKAALASLIKSCR